MKHYSFVLLVFLLLIVSVYFIFDLFTIELFTSQKKVLIIGGFPHHTECVGFLCEIFGDAIVSVFLNEDKFKYIDYYKKIYDIQMIQHTDELNYDNYDYIIKLTSDDPIIDTNNEKTVTQYKNKLISIIHMEEKKDLLNNYIIICPYFSLPNTNSEYILPIYRGLSFDGETKDVILYLGYFTRELFDDDIVEFNKKIKDKYTLIVSSYMDNAYLEEYNIKNLHNVDTLELIPYLKRTKYILSRKNSINKDRLSGAIPFAISHNIPLIIKKDVADDYSIKDISVVFNNNYCEIANEIMNNDNYQNIINNIEQYKNDKLNENKNKMKTLCDKLLA